jgi:hypothetical protein
LAFGVDSKDYSAATAQASVAIATSVANMLDQTATAFGTQAGYFAATAFADDSSKDGAWGALKVKLGDTIIADWETGRGIGREFADGEAGAKEYAAAIAKDMRDYLITQTPDWADNMLRALGDAPTLEGVVETAGKINQAAKMLEAMGRDKMTDTGAGAFEQLTEQFSYWTAEQQAQIAILNAQGKSQEALNRQRELDVALMTEDEKAARRRVFGLEDQVALATEQASLQQRLNEATMTRTELLALEREKVLPANRALFDHVTMMEAVADAVASAKDAMVSALEEVASELESAVDSFTGLLKTLAEFRTELHTDKAQLSPQAAYSAARRELEKNQELVAKGDLDAIGKFPDIASKFLEASKGYYSSSSGYFTDLGAVDSMLTAAEEAAKLAKESSDRQLTEAQTQINLLKDIQGNTYTTAKNTHGLDTSARIREAVSSMAWGTVEKDAISTKALGVLAKEFGWSTHDISRSLGYITEAQVREFFRAYDVTGVLTGPATASATATATSSTSGGSTGSGGVQNVGSAGSGSAVSNKSLWTLLDIQQYVKSLDFSAGSEGSSAKALYSYAKTEGWTQADIGAGIGWPEGDVRSFMWNAARIPAFSRGGQHSGGVRLVGENGPELEVTGASRIYSAQQTRDLLSSYNGQSDNAELVAELRALRAAVAELKQHSAANVRVAQAVGKAQIEALEVIADASADSAKSQRLMELAR